MVNGVKYDLIICRIDSRLYIYILKKAKMSDYALNSSKNVFIVDFILNTLTTFGYLNISLSTV